MNATAPKTAGMMTKREIAEAMDRAWLRSQQIAAERKAAKAAALAGK